MSILSYIKEKKEKFKNVQERRMTKRVVDNERRLKELEIKRKVLEEDSKILGAVRSEKAKIRALKKENSLVDKIGKNIKAKYKGEKVVNGGIFGSSGSDNIWTKKVETSNPFSQGSFGAPFSKGSVGKNVFSGVDNVKREKKARVRIIEYK